MRLSVLASTQSVPMYHTLDVAAAWHEETKLVCSRKSMLPCRSRRFPGNARGSKLRSLTGEKNYFGAQPSESDQPKHICLVYIFRPVSALKTYTMASKHASRALRNSLRQLSSPRVQQRTFTAIANGSRPALQKAATSVFVQQTRGKKTVDFAGDKEVVYGKIHSNPMHLHPIPDVRIRARRLAA